MSGAGASSRLSTVPGRSRRRTTSSSRMWRRLSAQWAVDPAGPAAFAQQRGGDRIGLRGAPGLPHRGDVVHVDVEPHTWLAHGIATVYVRRVELHDDASPDARFWAQAPGDRRVAARGT